MIRNQDLKIIYLDIPLTRLLGFLFGIKISHE